MVTSGRNALPRALAPACAAAFLMVGAQAARAAQADEAPPTPTSGPTEVRARGVEFRRFDPLTGKATMTVFAARASASGDSATLESVRFVRYSPGGAPILEASAEGGRILPGGSVAFDGEVAVTWRGAKAVATFGATSAVWDGKAGVLSSEGPVSGTLGDTGAASRKDAAAGGGSFRLDVEGTGLEVRPGGDSGRILRDVSAVGTGVALGPWRVTSDGGLGFSGLAGGSPALGFAGPVGLEGRGVTARADGAEVVLYKGDGEDDGGLAVSRAWLVGTVHARLDGERAFPWGEGPVEVRAESAEIDPAGPDARVVLLGTESDPARVIMPRGVLRGVRIEITPSAVRSDGGARSELEWGGAP